MSKFCLKFPSNVLFMTHILIICYGNRGYIAQLVVEDKYSGQGIEVGLLQVYALHFSLYFYAPNSK